MPQSSGRTQKFILVPGEEEDLKEGQTLDRIALFSPDGNAVDLMEAVYGEGQEGVAPFVYKSDTEAVEYEIENEMGNVTVATAEALNTLNVSGLDNADAWFVSLYWNFEYRQNGNGIKAFITVDDLPLRRPGGFNNQDMTEDTLDGSNGTWFMAMMTRDGYHKQVTPTAAKKREFGEGRGILLTGDSVAIKARVANSGDAAGFVRQSQLIARFEPVTDINS